MAEDNIGGFLGEIEKFKKALEDGGLKGAFESLETAITEVNKKFL